jgi:hypothetical protein
MKCKICRERRPRRFCPGVRGDICSICCGQEREVTVDCPLDCEYLIESRAHDRTPEPDPAQFPNQDIRVSESFLRENEVLLLMLANLLLRSALDTPGAVDNDVRDALESLVRTYRTLQSGLVYESLPQNMVAAAIHERIQASLAEYRQHLTQSGKAPFRDAAVLGVFAFLQRLEIQHNNGRRKGRAFLDFLSRYFVPGAPAGPVPDEAAAAPAASRLIIP